MEYKFRLSLKGVLRLGILYLMLVGMWCFFRSYMLFLALVLIPACVAVSGFSMWYNRQGLRCEALLPYHRVGKNTEFVFDMRIHNSSRFWGFTADLGYVLCNVFTGHKEHKKLRLWVSPAEGCPVRQQLKSMYAGRIEVEIEQFTIYDLFHIFALHGCARKSAGVIVWPAFDENSDEEINSCVEGFPQENESKKRGAEYNPDYEIREYIPGDELKSIHWKLTAKQDRLMVRERLATGREKINVLLPLGSDKSENDRLLEALYGLGRLLLNKEYPVQLYWPANASALQSCFVAEEGELENAISEILSGSGVSARDAGMLMEMEHPGEKYILIQTGAYKGAYIHS